MSDNDFLQTKNNAKSTSTELDNTDDPVTFDVDGGHGARFPDTADGPFRVTVWSTAYADPADDTDMEIMEVTSRTTDSLTATRAQEGTSKVAHSGTVNVAALDTSGLREEIITALPLSSMSRQALINGNFDVWQRGTSFTTPNAYSADRWMSTTTGGTHTISRQTFTVGQTDVPNNPLYYFRHVADASNSDARLTQRIEGCEHFAGQAVTLSFWAKAGAGLDFKSIDRRQNFGSGGSANVEASLTGGDITLTTSWQQFTITETLPSISGKTVGVDNYLSYEFKFPDGAFTIDMSEVQLCAGSVALPFQPKSKGQEELDCMRYTEVINYSQRETIGVLFFTDSGSFKMPLKYKVRKRAIPTITLPTTAADNVFSTSSADGAASFVDSSTLASSGIGLNGCTITGDVMTASYATNDVGNMDIRSTDGLIIIDSEL